LSQTPSLTPPRRRLSTPAQVGLLIALAAVLILALVTIPWALRAAAAKPDVAPPQPPPGTFKPTPEQWRTLTFAPIRAMSFADQVSTDGKVAVDDDATVQITPPFSGRVISVVVRAGDRVAKGQVMLTAQASEVAQARNDLTAAEAALTTAKAQLQVASANATRQQALFKLSGAAQRDVQQSESDLAAAQGAVKSDIAALAVVRDRLKVLDVGAVSQGEINSNGLAALRSPIAGVVIQRQVGPGQYLNATSNGATTPIFTVSDLSKVWLTANVREEDAARIHVGQPIEVRVAGLPDRSFHARIDFVGATLDPATRRLPVRATLANPGGLLKPEMFADFALGAGPSEQALGAPASAVIFEGDTARVWVVRQDRTLALRPIKAGRTANGQVEVLAGLNAGDRVASSGAIFIDRAAKGD